LNSIQRIFKNILSLGLSSTLPRLSSFVLIIYIARFLGDESFGKYSTAIYFAVLVSLLADLGLSKLTVRELSKNRGKADYLFHPFLLIKLFFITITYLIIVLGCNLLSYSKEICDLIYIFGAAACTVSLSRLFYSAFEAFEKMEYGALVTTVQALLKFGLGLTVLILDLGLRALAISFVIVRLIELLLIVCLFYTKLSKFKPALFKLDFNLLKEMFIQTLPFSAFIIVSEVYFKSDMIMLSKMRPMEEVGWYSSVYNLIIGLLLFPRVMMGSLFPVMSRFSQFSIENLKTVYERSFKYLFYIAILIAVVSTFFANDLVKFFYGQQFINAAIVLQIIVWILPFAFAEIIISNIFISLNRLKFQIVIVGIGLIINVLLNFIFIPKWGYAGAGITTLISAVLNFTLFFIYATKKFYKISLLTYAFKATVAAVPLYFVWTIINEYKLYFLFNMLICVASYLLILWLIKAFDGEDKEILGKLVPRRFRFVA